MKPDQNAARLLSMVGGVVELGDKGTPADGYVLTIQADGTAEFEAPGASGVGGSTGATDNALIRADGTGGATVQSSGITVADAVSGVAEVTSARLVRGVRAISSSPDTQLQSDDTLTFAAATTVDLLTSCTTGREFLYVCTAAATLTLDPGGTDTIDGGSAGAALAIPCAAGQAVRLIRVGSGAWRAVLPGSVVTMIEADIEAGAWRAAGYANIAGVWTRITSYVAPSGSGDPETWGFSLSGDDILVTTSAGVINTATATEAPYWSWSLAELGAVLAPAPHQLTVEVSVTSISLTGAGVTDSNGVAGCFSTASDLTTGALYAYGIGKASSNYGRLSEDENAVPIQFDIGPTVRKIMYATVATVAHTPYGHSFDGSDGIVSSSAAPACASSGTPTHIGVQLLKINTPRAGTIAAPRVRWYL